MSLDSLIQDNLHFLRQGCQLLSDIDDRLFTEQPDLPMSPVGGHLRHCTDFYAAFLDGVGQGRIDYDARQRDPRLEVDRGYALDNLTALMTRLELLAPDTDGPLQVSMDRSPGQAAPGDGADCWAQSSVARELQFLRSHTVHHYALISTLLRLLGYQPDDDLGVAPATLAHRHQLARR